MNDDPFQPLAGIFWHKAAVRLQNTRNLFAREHPLSIFQGMFNYAACRSGVKAEFFFHPVGAPLGERIRKDHVYDLEIIFPAAAPEEIERFLDGLAKHLEAPRFNFTLLHAAAPQLRNLAVLEREWGPEKTMEEICLDFLTPFPFKPKKCGRQWLVDRDIFFQLLINRLNRFYQLTLPDPGGAWQDIRLLPYYWEYEEHRHRSKSGNGHQYINGTTGPLYLRGPVERILPLLLVCSELHGGRRLAAGQGYYILRRNHSFFDIRLADYSLFQAMMAELEKNSDRADEIASTFVDAPASLRQIHTNLADGRFDPSSAAGFHLEKRRGGKRLIAALELRDYLAHKFLQHLLAPVADRMFEEASVGFRAGRSRETARQMIRQACAEGLQYVLESDIEAFFDQLLWDLLEKKLADHLPRADRRVLSLLGRVIRQPLAVNGQPVERQRGLIQGSPLSPLLANLYLDSLDEEMEEKGYRLIRYGDDFLVMTRSREEADQALTDVRAILAGLGLALKEEKTSTTPVDMGFSFLGLAFDAAMDEDFVAGAGLGKTLFVRDQYAFMGVDGDSVTIKKDKVLLARLPIKRIGEIVVLGNNSLSTRLLQKCVAEHIPVSFCSPMGYYQATLRPDSKNHFLMAARHAERFRALSEEERIIIAARLITAKLHNYLAWLRERWPSESRETAHHVETAVASLAKADSVERIRGYEGIAARYIFIFVNRLCQDQVFHCRERKKRDGRDCYNSLLDFAYSLLFTRLNVLLRGQGLNPYLGILHSHKDNYESLVCDLQEPFRCRMDRFVVKTINRNVIKSDDFGMTDHGRYRLSNKAIGTFLEAFEREMAVRLAGDNGTLKQLLVAQVRSVKDWVEEKGGLLLYQAGLGRAMAGEAQPGFDI